MEFFKLIQVKTTKESIQKNINFDNINKLCESIFVIDSKNDIATIGSIWGEFSLKKEAINGGLRFSLIECPNALAFTLTTGYPPEPESIVLHLTTNRYELSTQFVEEIEALMDDWKIGIEKNYQN